MENTYQIQVSQMAAELNPPSILAFAYEIRRRKAEGENVADYTIGDYNTQDFGLPAGLTKRILMHYEEGHTNYPPAFGIAELRQEVADFYKEELDVNYDPDKEVLIAAGVRPHIFGAYMTLLDPGDRVIFGEPSWNNEYYSHIVGAHAQAVPTKPESRFLLTLADVEHLLPEATLLCLGSPANPAGTVYDAQTLTDLARAVVAENKRREPRGVKPLYMLYDQVYWKITFGEYKHHHPVALVPEVKPYCISVDGASKYFAATGIRVGWSTGPTPVMQKMTGVLAHVGAWAPKPEQMALADYLPLREDRNRFIQSLSDELYSRLRQVYDGFEQMRVAGLPVRAIPPMGGMFMSVYFGVQGWKTSDGEQLKNNTAIRDYLLNKAQSGLLPFDVFGAVQADGWFRIAVGGLTKDEIAPSLERIHRAIAALES